MKNRQDCYDRCAQYTRMLVLTNPGKYREKCHATCWETFPMSLWERFINWVLVGKG